MKTLEDVKEYFKDADEIECAEGDGLTGRFSNMDERGIHEWFDAFWITDNDTKNVCLYDNDNPEKGFARIISTK